MNTFLDQVREEMIKYEQSYNRWFMVYMDDEWVHATAQRFQWALAIKKLGYTRIIIDERGVIIDTFSRMDEDAYRN